MEKKNLFSVWCYFFASTTPRPRPPASQSRTARSVMAAAATNAAAPRVDPPLAPSATRRRATTTTTRRSSGDGVEGVPLADRGASSSRLRRIASRPRPVASRPVPVPSHPVPSPSLVRPPSYRPSRRVATDVSAPRRRDVHHPTHPVQLQPSYTSGTSGRRPPRAARRCSAGAKAARYATRRSSRAACAR